MIPAERRQRILTEIRLRGSVEVGEVAARWAVSAMTIRRDLAELASRGELERVHGGAVAPRGARGARAPLATLGLVLPSATYYFAEVLRGARAAASELGIRLVLAVSDYDPDREADQVGRLLRAGIDGLLITPCVDQQDDPGGYLRLVRAPVPVVVLERDLDAGGPDLLLSGVRSDHHHGAELSVRHLSALGHTRIVLALRDSPTARHLSRGVARAVSTDPGGLERWELGLSPATAPHHEARQRLVELLELVARTGATAAVVAPDDAAIGLQELALDRGLDLPAELSIVAYDDELAALAPIPLTAVCPPKLEVGARGVRICLELLRGSSTPTGRSTLLPSLTIRDSTTTRPAPD